MRWTLQIFTLLLMLVVSNEAKQKTSYKLYVRKNSTRYNRGKLFNNIFLKDEINDIRSDMVMKNNSASHELNDTSVSKRKSKHTKCPFSKKACKEELKTRKLVRVAQIKDKILKHIGLTSPPNMSNIVISENPSLQKEIKLLNEKESVRFTRREKQSHVLRRTYADQPLEPKDKLYLPVSKVPAALLELGKDVIYFDLASKIFPIVENAILHLWLLPDDNRKYETFATINIFMIKPDNGSDLLKLSVIDSGIDVEYISKGNWITIDVSTLVKKWIASPEFNLGIVLDIQAFTTGSKVYFGTMAKNPSYAPTLELELSDEKNGRQKRFANNRVCTKRKLEKICCRYPFEVNFVDLDFDFVLAPKRYKANLCRGDCPFVFAQKYAHAKLIEQMINDSDSNHGPCCGARELEPLRMIYQDGNNNGFKVSVVKDMVVVQCSCT